MNIDLKTLFFLICISSLLQAMILFVQFRLNKNYKGLEFWAVSGVLVAIAQLIFFLRDIIPFALVSIILPNIMLIATGLFLYTGTTRFFGKKVNYILVVFIFIASLLLFIYYTYVNDNITMRSIVASLTFAINYLLIAYSLNLNKNKAISLSVKFLIIVMLVNCLFHLVRAVSMSISVPIKSIDTPTLFQIGAYLIYFITGILYTFGFVFMINQRMNSEINEAKENLEKIFNAMPDAVIIIRYPERDIVEVNERFFEITGYNNSDLVGRTTLDINIWEDSTLRDKVYSILEEYGYLDDFEANFIMKDGRRITGLLSARIIYLQGVTHLVIILQDITERKLKEKELLYISYHDNLTGLLNRRRFDDLLYSLEESGQVPVSIIIGDINGLKLTNDAYGHSSGDEIIKRIAQIIKKCSGKDSYVSRYGGDEFAIILPGVSIEEADLKVMQMKDCCKEESTNELILNITFGVSCKTEKEQNLEICQRLAEERMYTGKLLESKNIRSSIIENLRLALEEKTGETRNHCIRMAKLAQAIGIAMGMQSYEIDDLKLLALLHDIGKTGIPESILNKPGKLDHTELLLVRKHSEIGYRIACTMPELISIAEGILTHHERWDGKGYPQGLSGENIPFLGRVIAIIDAFDAMTHDRPYSKAMSTEEALQELSDCSGTQFDPNITRIFINEVYPGI